MFRKPASLIMLSLLVVSTLSLAVNVQPVKPDYAWTETIYVRADGSIDPPTAPISSVDNVTYTLTDTIAGNFPASSSAINIQRDNTTIDGAGHTLQGTQADYSIGIDLTGRSNVTIKNMKITAYAYGIFLYSSSDNCVSGNNITNNSAGIGLLYSSNNNSVSGNNITNNSYGVYLDSSNNTIYHNNFMNNTSQVYSSGSTNVWDGSYPSGGNYWSDYAGLDLYSSPYQNETGSDGIGDLPYTIGANNKDNYPLMKPYPWAAHDVGVTSVATSKNVVGQGYDASINVMIFDYGNDAEIVNVTIYANQTVIGEIQNINLTSRNFTAMALTWNTTGFARGNYTLSAYAEPVPGETDFADNNFTGEWVVVSMVGDLTGGGGLWDFVPDGRVDGSDLSIVARCFGSWPGARPPMIWNINCDVNNDGVVDGSDLATVARHFGEGEQSSHTIPQTPPIINDFWVTGTNSSGNVTWAGFPGMFSFNLSDTVGLDHAIFGCNNTGQWVNNTNMSLFGTGPVWDNYTLTFNNTNCFLAFNYTVWNTNTTISATTGMRIIKLYTYNSMVGAWNTPFQNLGTAISTVEAANNWTQVESYTQTILDQQNGSVSSYMSKVIDSFNPATDPLDVLMYSAFCNKLNITEQQTIKNALGNFTMVGSLPYTGTDNGRPDMSTQNKWALYGFWYANNSWANASKTKWNITAAYKQFDAAVNYSVANAGGLPLWIYADGTGATFSNRYYDEEACTVECYLIFYSLLNVSDALNKALYWWSYLNANCWTGTHYKYTPSWDTYECEAAFFLKIISILKYYHANLGSWSNVLTDIGNRFLSQEWNSPQWGGVSTSYVVEHANPGNPQRRLKNTFGTWQALLGIYAQLTSTYESNVIDMLYGNNNTEPAWALLLRPEAGLFDNSTNLFRGASDRSTDYISTALGEMLMFMLGIVPGTTTIAFPLEELQYEYIYDADPALLQLQLNSTFKEIRVSVTGPGTMTFQYGTSPVTVSFNQSGVFYVRFTNSWNMILNSSYPSYQGALPSNLIYFSQLATVETSNLNSSTANTGSLRSTEKWSSSIGINAVSGLNSKSPENLFAPTQTLQDSSAVSPYVFERLFGLFETSMFPSLFKKKRARQTLSFTPKKANTN